MEKTSRDIAKLVEKLALLRWRDKQRVVFGAGRHGYALQRATLRDLLDLEAHIGVTLPGDYRTWLIEVGYGAGPYYGLFSPQRIAEELCYSESGTGGDVADASKIDGVQLQRFFETVREAGSHVENGISANSLIGAVPVGEQGCGSYSHILVAGKYEGAMFGECEELLAYQATPLTAFWREIISNNPAVDQRPLSFLQWMDYWLDTSIALVR